MGPVAQLLMEVLFERLVTASQQPEGGVVWERCSADDAPFAPYALKFSRVQSGETFPAFRHMESSVLYQTTGSFAEYAWKKDGSAHALVVTVHVKRPKPVKAYFKLRETLGLDADAVLHIDYLMLPQHGDVPTTDDSFFWTNEHKDKQEIEHAHKTVRFGVVVPPERFGVT